MPPLPVTRGAVVEVARLRRSQRLPEEADAEDAGDGGKLPGHGPQQGPSASHGRSLGVRASITFNPLQPTDQPAENGANVRRLKQTEPLAVEVSHRAVVDEQGIGLRPIGSPQGMHVAAEAISHARAGHHNAR
jgi:hypothetical protein